MKNTLINPELTSVLQEASAVIKNNIRRGGIYCFATHERQRTDEVKTLSHKAFLFFLHETYRPYRATFF